MLGRLLLRNEVVTPVQLAAGLRQQVIYGGRLGTNLLELGYTDHDQLARSLADLHEVPAALTRHLRNADKRARMLVPATLCRELAVVPLAFARAGGRRLVVCMRDPKDREAVEQLREVAKMDIVSAVCPELTLYRLLEHYFAAPLPARMMRTSDEPTTPLPRGPNPSIDTLDPAELTEAPGIAKPLRRMPTLSLVDLDDEGVERDPTQISESKSALSLGDLAARLRQKRSSEAPAPPPDPPPAPPPPARAQPRAQPSPAYAFELGRSGRSPLTPQRTRPAQTEPADGDPPHMFDEAPTNVAAPSRANRPSPSPSEATLHAALTHAAEEQRIAAITSALDPVPLGPPAMGIDRALAQIKRAKERSAVSDAVIGFLKTHFDAGLILVVRDDVAYGYRGFGGHFDEESVESILVPLKPTSPFQQAYSSQRRYFGTGGASERSLFGRFLLLFPIVDKPELIVVDPVELHDRIVCLIYAHSTASSDPSDEAFDDLAHIAKATSDAFLRLIRQQRTG